MLTPEVLQARLTRFYIWLGQLALKDCTVTNKVPIFAETWFGEE